MTFPPDRSSLGPVPRLFAVLLSLALLAAACGSSDPDDTATADPTPTAQAAESTAVPESDDGDETPVDETPVDETPEPTVPATNDGADDAPDDTPVDDATADPADDELDPTALALAGETIDWTDCGLRLQCGIVEVPADYNDESLGTIEIAVNVFRSPDADERIGYLLMNPGGPGESGVDLVAASDLVGFPQELTDAFDLVGFDPRGVGASEPTFACGTGAEQFDLLNQIVDDIDTDEEIALGQQAAQLCIDSMGPVGARLHSEFVARDMDEIRQALGADQISYLGFSYGSALGGWYASLFPENVYSMVLDGASNPLQDADGLEEAIALARDTVGPLHDQFANALASCDSAACPIYNNGDPEAYWYGMADKFNLVSEAKGGNSAAIVLGIVGHLYSETLWPTLHQSIFDLAENDDPSGFVAAIDNAGTVDEASVTGHINCLDSWALFPDETLGQILAEAAELNDQVDAAIEDDYPLLYALDLPEQAQACPFYESIDPPVFTGTFDGGGIPILVVGNTSDPVTPFIQSEQYANDVLADGRLVKVAHPQHVVYPANTCINDLVHAALIDGEYPDDEPVCESDEVPGLDAVEMTEFALPDGATAVRPAGWIELDVGIFAQTSSPLDPALLVYVPSEGDPETIVDFFSVQGSIDTEVAGTIDVNGTTWTLYRGEVPSEGLGVRIATSPGANGMVILGQSFIDEVDQLEQYVMQPAVEGFTPAS